MPIGGSRRFNILALVTALGVAAATLSIAVTPADAQDAAAWTPVSRTVSHLTSPGGGIVTCTIEQLREPDGTVTASRSLITADHVPVPFGLGDGRQCLAGVNDSFVAFDDAGNMYFSYNTDGLNGFGIMSIDTNGAIRWANDFGTTWPFEITVGGDGLLYGAMYQADSVIVLDPINGERVHEQDFLDHNFGQFVWTLVAPSTTGAAVADASGPRYLDWNPDESRLNATSYPSFGPNSMGGFGPDDTFVQVTNRRTPNGTWNLCQQDVVFYERAAGQVKNVSVGAPYDTCGLWFGEATADGGLVGYTSRGEESLALGSEWYFFRVSPDGQVAETTHDPVEDVNEPGELRLVDVDGNLVTFRSRNRLCDTDGAGSVRCDIVRAVVFDSNNQIHEFDVDPTDPIGFAAISGVLTPGLLTLTGNDRNLAENPTTSIPNTRPLPISFVGEDYTNVRYYELVGNAEPPPPPSEFRMFSMGDSYSSGEGLIEQTSSYECGTDVHRGRYHENTTLSYMSLRSYAVALSEDPGIEFETGCDTVTENSIIRGEVVGDLFGLRYENLCHRSATAYPSILSDRLGVTNENFGFSACSGARFRDFYVDGQYPRSPEGVIEDDPTTSDVGGQSQIAALRRFIEQHGSVDLVTIGLGGNDVSFNEVITECLFPDCARDAYKKRISRSTESLYSNLWRALAEIREIAGPQADVVVFGYPIVVDPDNWCAPSSLEGALVSPAERVWIADTLIPDLNATLRDAATGAGVHFIDISEAVAGREICSTEGGYINDIRPGDDIGGVIANESFHPNEQGHTAIAEYVLPALQAIVSDGQGNPNPTTCRGQLPTVFGNTGTDGADVILGRSLPDTIRGRGGSDLICARGGSDRVTGGVGDDTIYGDGGDDLILSHDGNDTIYGGPGADQIIGGRGDDLLVGGQDDDDLSGRGGADRLIGGDGTDTCNGGAGLDSSDGSCETTTRIELP